MTYGISLWLPFHGTGTIAARNAPYYGSGFTPVEPYAFWSNVSPSLGFGVDMRVREIDYAALRRLISEWREMNPNYYGDFYPLTTWSRDDQVWIAWQFDRAEQGEGVVQAFRRDKSSYESARLKLRGLEPAARYAVANLDALTVRQELTGSDLRDTGLLVEIPSRPAAAVIIYRKIK
jgi:alpha-galactosidase